MALPLRVAFYSSPGGPEGGGRLRGCPRVFYKTLSGPSAIVLLRAPSGPAGGPAPRGARARPDPSRQEAVRCLWGRPGVLHVPRALPGRAPGTPPNGEERLYDEGLEYDMGWKAWWTDSASRSELTESTAGEALLDMLRPEGGPESLAILERVSGRHPVLAAFHLPAGQSFLLSECGARCGSLCHAGWWARRRWRTGAAGGRPLPRDQVLPWLHVHL